MRAAEGTAAVGVVVPVYNRLGLLEETVASLRAQTLEHAQFVLVDDRSDEPVWRYLQSVASSDDRFLVVRKPSRIGRGSQESRNLGLDSVDAEGVVFLDSDDLLEPGCLEHRIAFLRANPGADIVVGNQAVMGHGAPTWVNVPYPGRHYLDRFLECAGQIDVPWVNGGVLIRLDRLRASGVRWRPEFHWDDLVFHVECLLAGMKAIAMPSEKRADSWYRSHDEERFGSVLASAAGIENTANMFQWIDARLAECGQASQPRSLALRRSFFHFCVRQPLELGERDLARGLIDRAESTLLITRQEARRMRVYAAAFFVRGVSSRLSARLVGLAGSGLLKDFFEQRKSTFSVVPVN